MCRFIDIVALVTQIHIITTESTRTTHIPSGQTIECPLLSVQLTDSMFMVYAWRITWLRVDWQTAPSYYCTVAPERSN